jgi:hypothetical protein
MKYKFLCGNAFKSACQYSVGKYLTDREHDFNFSIKEACWGQIPMLPHPQHTIEEGRQMCLPDSVFIKTEYVGNFFHYINLEKPFRIFTHNSDIPVDERFSKFLEDSRVLSWHGQNIDIKHEKVTPIPIGLANPKWPHGNPEVFEKVRNDLVNGKIKKDKLFYVNFDIYSNIPERQKCLREANLELEPKLDFESYLREVARSYFVISPDGNGIDCHKNWEALYLDSVPVVSKGINVNYFKDKGIPFLIVDEWAELKNIKFCPKLYEKIWSNFDSDLLLFENYLLNLNTGEF